MNSETKQETIVNENTGLDSKRIDLRHEEYLNKPRYFGIKNWRTIEKEIKDNKTIVEWKADVTKYGDSVMLLNVVTQESPKELAESATAFRLAVNKLLAGKNTQSEVLLRIKYSGKDNGKHKFDVELG